jgi:large subunit ribosomal protein L31e
MLREFAEKHMKSSEIKIDMELNEEIWKRGITKPPRRITVKMEKDEDGVVTISLPKKAKKEVEEKIPEAPKREERPAEPVKPAVAASEPAKTTPAAEEKAPKKPRKNAPRKKTEKA